MARDEMLALLKRVTVFNGQHAQLEFISSLSNIQAPTVLSFLNQHGFNLAYDDPQMFGALMNSNILVRDGVGIEIGMRLLGLPPGLNSCGTDIIPSLLKSLPDRRIAIFGTREPWLSRASAEISSWGVSVVDVLDGFQPDSKYLERFAATQPDVVLLAMGMPKQEILSIRLRDAALKPCLIINGGAVVDFIGGKIPRAPMTIQSLRLEWLFRLASEPRRLADRYLIGGPLFLARLANLWLHRAGTRFAKIDV
ncbi:MAG: WecB/TagA/CpsF family glycosyltransferase [Hyphomicrobium sp.]